MAWVDIVGPDFPSESLTHLQRIHPAGAAAQFAGRTKGFEAADLVDAVGDQSRGAVAAAVHELAFGFNGKGARGGLAGLLP